MLWNGLDIAYCMQVVMRDPKYIYLQNPSHGGSTICECLERSSRLSDVLPLLEQHRLVYTLERSCSVVPKRQDGTTIGGIVLQLRDTLEAADEMLGNALVRHLSLQNCCGQ